MGILFYFVHNQNAKIQAERRASVIRSCVSQNMRHDNTIKTLDKEISQLPPDRQAQAAASRKFTILIIDALAPKKNCEKQAEIAVGH